MTKLKVGDLVRTLLGNKEFGLVMKIRPRPAPDESIDTVLYVLCVSGRTGHWFESDLEKA